MVERLTADHYFVAAENIEFSEWVDVAVADTLPASERTAADSASLKCGTQAVLAIWVGATGRALIPILVYWVLVPNYRFMKYRQLDRIVSLEPGQRIVAERTLGRDEEYLRDHFPRFPVMPGVMMLEALHQAAIWMIRTGDDFQSPLVLLREARNVKFGDFLSPNETLKVTAERMKEVDGLITVKATAEKQGRVTVAARLIFERSGSSDPPEIGTDEDVVRRSKKQFKELFGDVLFTAPPTT